MESLAGGGRNQISGYSSLSSIPNGSLAPQAFILPQKPGNMASVTDVIVNISKTDADLIPSYNLLFSSSSSITITNAQLDQIVAMLVNAGMSLSIVQGILSGAANASMSSSGNITVTNAQCGAIIDFLVQGNCSITPNMFLTALANLECEIGGATPLSPEGLAQAVWESKNADYTENGTMGKAMSDAGGAGNPWSAPLAGNTTPGTFGWFVQKLLTTAKFLGLK